MNRGVLRWIPVHMCSIIITKNALSSLLFKHVLSALYDSQLTQAALLMQEPDPWSKYSSRERNVIDTLAETETDTYMLIRSGGQLLDQ